MYGRYVRLNLTTPISVKTQFIRERREDAPHTVICKRKGWFINAEEKTANYDGANETKSSTTTTTRLADK